MQPVGKTTVQPGDHLLKLSTRLMGDPMRYTELIILNNLKPPYISTTRADGVLTPGDTILYPSDGTEATLSINSQELERRTYKRDFISFENDLQLNGLEIQSISGLDNLRAALMRRLSTPVGSHPFHPEYGSRVGVYVGNAADPALLQLAVNDAKAAILQDPRVVDCSIYGEWENERLHFEFTITPIPPGSPFTFDAWM